MRLEIADFEERLRHGDAKDISERALVVIRAEVTSRVSTPPPDLSKVASAVKDEGMAEERPARGRKEGEAGWQRVTGLQRAMVLAALKGPDRALYQQQLVVRLKQPVAVAEYLEAARVCCARHGGLMARFEFRGEELWQGRLSEQVLPGVESDLSQTGGSPEEQLARFLAADANLHFPLTKDEPAWRSTFLHLGRGEQVWVLTFHHAICDAWPLAPLLGEIFAAYDRLRAGASLNREAVPPEMSDHLAWLQSQDWSEQEEEWRRRFSPGEMATPWPEVRGYAAPARPPRPALHRAAVPIEPELEKALRALAERADVTANTIVLGALAFWLGRMRGEEKVVLGAMRAARRSSIAGAEAIVGTLTNTLPVKIDLAEDIPLTTWLGTIRREWFDLRPLEHCSLGQILNWTGLELGASGLPVLFNFQRMTLNARLEAAGLSYRCAAELKQKNDLSLLLSAFELPRLEVEIVWQTDRIPDAVGQAAATGIGRALREFTRNPQQTLAGIALLSPADHAKVEQAARGPQKTGAPATAHAMIEERIRQQPDATAIATRRETFTYRELGALAENIASALEHGAVIATLLPPGPEIAAVMLGALRVGAVFFLINPNAPRAEWTAMLRRLKITTLIVPNESLAEAKENFPESRNVDELISGADASPCRPRPVAPHDLAYLVHTSGSSGEKKFVEIEHHSLAHALAALVELFGIGPVDRRIARASPGTDYFISEFLVTLSGGGTVVIPSSTEAMSVADYLEEMRRERITLTGIPASYWHEWVRTMDENLPVDLPPTLRLVLSGMERVNAEMVVKWQRLVGSRVCWLNVYGPAETTLIATAYGSTDRAAPDPINVRIGRPVGQAEVRVLDPYLRMLPPGITGELCISGPGVARGYRDDEKATRLKFLSNPHASTAGARLYRTGDYGYLDEAGYFVFVGRRDEQVKIRGHRVELGEIEAILQRHPAIRQAVVTLAGDEMQKWLVAHVVPFGELDKRDLQDWLKKQAAPHLRPAELIVLQELPMLRSGKVDRRALAQASASRAPDRGEVCKSFSTSVEGKLHGLWSELFGGRHAISATDNFFDCGGDSLQAVPLLSAIEQHFGTSLSLQDLFAHPTVAELAGLIERGRTGPEYTSLSRLNSTLAGTPLLIVHGWGGGVFHAMEFARRLNGQRPVSGLQAVELAGLERHQSVEEMAAHYADEIIREYGSGPTELLGHSLGGLIAYATACELARRGHRVGKLFIVDTIPSNLPKWVHLKFLAPRFRARFPMHARAILQTWPRYWPRFIRARRRSLRALMKKRRAIDVPRPVRKNDYYRGLAARFVPARMKFDVRLLTPDSDPIDTYWRYLVGPQVHVTALRSGHVDMFALEHLEGFLAAFQQADEGEPRSSAANSIKAKPESEASV